MSQGDTRRARAHLRRKAEELGYESAQSMVTDLYIVRRTPFIDLARVLLVTEFQLRNAMREWNIPIRTRGGPNGVRTFATSELVQEVTRDGLSLVAKRLGISPGNLQIVLSRYKP